MKLKLGIIGMSEGNGHPYSWSAICNGYDEAYMKDCPFPVIPEYLSKEKYPENFLSDMAEVTHIWTQERQVSDHIAHASRIANVVDRMEDMIPYIDAVILARDDAENHYRMALPFLKAGLPLFIDKPLALSLKEAGHLLQDQVYDEQIFTCSSLRYAEELVLSEEDKRNIGAVRYIEACIPKRWETYAVHLIEPIVAANKDRGMLTDVQAVRIGEVTSVTVRWEHLVARIGTYGKHGMPLEIRYFGEDGISVKGLDDTFNAFKRSIGAFIEQIGSRKNLIPRAETLEIIKIIEAGNYA